MSVFLITMQWEFGEILRINVYLSKQLLPLHSKSLFEYCRIIKQIYADCSFLIRYILEIIAFN